VWVSDCFFFFAVQPVDDSVTQAVVFLHNPDLPRFVELSELTWQLQDELPEEDPASFLLMKAAVNQFLQSQMKTELPQQTPEKAVAEKSPPKKKRQPKANIKFSPTQKLSNKRKRTEGGYITKKNKPRRKPKAPTPEPEPEPPMATNQRKIKAPKQKPEKPEKDDIHAKLDSIVTAIGGMQQQINALKSEAAENTAVSQFASGGGVPFVLPTPPAQPQPQGQSSEVLQAMKMMTGVMFMSTVRDFFR
jgi:DNA mismatch repair ATPase MutL